MSSSSIETPKVIQLATEATSTQLNQRIPTEVVTSPVTPASLSLAMTPDPTTPANILNPVMTEDLGDQDAVAKRLDFDQASFTSFVFFHFISLICTVLIFIAFFCIALFLFPQIVEEPEVEPKEEEARRKTMKKKKLRTGKKLLKKMTTSFAAKEQDLEEK